MSVLALLAVAQHASADVAGADVAGAPPPEVLEVDQAYEVSQDAIGRLVGDYELRDQRGQALNLASLRGRPLVISLIYTSCATVCPVATDHMRDAVIAARKTLGDGSFSVLTFGFDASGDRPAQLRAFEISHGLSDQKDWRLASADPDVTEALLRDVGFSWRAAAGSFEHVTQTTILDAEGRVYRQIYGEAFPLPVFMEPLKELVLGRKTRSLAPKDLWNRLTFICTVYNPLTGAYRFDYSIFFGVFFGAFSLILTAWVVVRLWLEKRRAGRPAGPMNSQENTG